MTVTWRSLAAQAERDLRAAGLPSPEVDARRIVERASGNEGADYALALDDPATTRSVAFFDQMVARRAGGEPLQYVLGRWGFRQLDLLVDRRVLIPRPETEVVVDHALAEFDRLRAAGGQTGMRVVDLGTGSGAIALSIAFERPSAAVWATDVSDDALDVARANLAGLGRAGSRVQLCRGSWFDALPDELAGTVDLVISNPPYIAEHEALPSEVIDWEPRGALLAGPSGTEALERLVVEAPRWLTATGSLVLELAPDQAPSVRAAMVATGFSEAEIVVDLAGRDRAVVGRRLLGP